MRSLTNQDLTRHLDASHWIGSPEGENSNAGTLIVGVVVQPARLEVAAREIATFEEVSYLVMISGAANGDFLYPPHLQALLPLRDVPGG